MRVAVLGSWDEKQNARTGNPWPLLETPAEFRAACREIGRELVRRGHSLIVGSAREHTADCHAALGALEAVRETPAESITAPRIVVVRKSSAGPTAFGEFRRSDPGVFVEHPVAAGSEAAAKLFQARLADALVLVGGGVHTEQAGLAGAACKKPLACIGSFGGAARALNGRFFEAPAYWGYEPGQSRQLLQLQEPFSPVVLKTALEVAWIEGAPKLMLIHGRSPDRDLLKAHLKQSGIGNVVVLADRFHPTEPIPDKFERYAASVDGAIALVTPDDVGGLAADTSETEQRARQNVWIEVGWFWGRLGRSKVLLLTKGKVVIPSDIGNVEHFDYTDDPRKCDPVIAKFIQKLRLGSDI
jgi:hypothetical protein